MIAHLLPLSTVEEQGAFVFAQAQATGRNIVLRRLDWKALRPTDFATQSPDYLELRDSVRAFCSPPLLYSLSALSRASFASA